MKKFIWNSLMIMCAGFLVVLFGLLSGQLKFDPEPELSAAEISQKLGQLATYGCSTNFDDEDCNPESLERRLTHAMRAERLAYVSQPDLTYKTIRRRVVGSYITLAGQKWAYLQAKGAIKWSDDFYLLDAVCREIYLNVHDIPGHPTDDDIRRLIPPDHAGELVFCPSP